MAVSVSDNVIICSANGDTIQGPLNIDTIVVTPAGTSPAATVTSGSVVIFDSGTLTAGASVDFQEVGIRIGGGKTLTIGLAGTGTKVRLYLK